MSQHAGPSTPDRVLRGSTLEAQEHRGGHPIVSALIGARVAAAGLFALAFLHGLQVWAALLFGLGCITDWLDGALARRLGAPPRLNPYADAVADLCLVLAALSVLAAEGIYPWWTLLLAGAMFLQFILTSGPEGPVYDPLGKYYGVGLFAIIGLTLLFPHPAVCAGAPAAILLLTGAAVVSRAAYLLGRREPGPSAGATREQNRQQPKERTP